MKNIGCIGFGIEAENFRHLCSAVSLSLAFHLPGGLRLFRVFLVVAEDGLCRLRRGLFWLDVWPCPILYSRTDFVCTPLTDMSVSNLSEQVNVHTAFCFQIPIFGVIYQVANANLDAEHLADVNINWQPDLTALSALFADTLNPVRVLS